MSEFIVLLVGIGFFLLVIAITKAIWQWVLGTDILIAESRQQTKLLERLVILAKNSDKSTSLTQEEKARLIDEKG
jgi:hypothetical protein